MKRVRRIDFLLLAFALLVFVQSADGSGEKLSTWSQIQRDIFNPNCISCHAAGTSFARQSGLVLTADVAFGQLVKALPRNTAARED